MEYVDEDGDIFRFDETLISLEGFNRLFKLIECEDAVNIFLKDSDDLPSIEGKNYKKWYKNGKLHRLGEPAWIYFNLEEGIRAEYWYRNGLNHRLNGPANVEYKDNEIIDESYCLRGKDVEKELFLEITESLKENDEISFKLKFGHDTEYYGLNWK